MTLLQSIHLSDQAAGMRETFLDDWARWRTYEVMKEKGFTDTEIIKAQADAWETWKRERKWSKTRIPKDNFW